MRCPCCCEDSRAIHLLLGEGEGEDLQTNDSSCERWEGAWGLPGAVFESL